MRVTTYHRQSKVDQRLKAKGAVKAKVVYTGIASLLLLALAGCTQTTPQERNLSAVVAHYTDQTFPEYKHAFIDLNNDGVDDALIFLQGRSWCGPDGCVLLVLQGEGEGYRIISKSTLTRDPVRVSESVSNGWNDIIVHNDGAEKLLQFAEGAYPEDPSKASTATQEQVDSAKTVFQ